MSNQVLHHTSLKHYRVTLISVKDGYRVSQTFDGTADGDSGHDDYDTAYAEFLAWSAAVVEKEQAALA